MRTKMDTISYMSGIDDILAQMKSNPADAFFSLLQGQSPLFQ